MITTRWLEARAPRGMVATPHVLASESGLAALRAGGNALDAAIAAAATIAVVYPHMNGVGGDNVWLIHDAGADRLLALCGIGRSARAASIDWYAARGMGEAIPIRGGPAALTVPGAVDGWWQAHQYSTRSMGSALPWKALFGDAIAYAREGFSPSAGQRVAPPAEPDLFGPTAIVPIKEHLWPLYHPDSLAQGPLIQRDIALTLEAVRDGGPDAFYGGDLARRIVAALSAAGSPLALEDFTEHRSEWMEPLRVAYRNGHAASFPPPTQGIPALAILALADRFDIANLDETDYIHVLVEATKLAFEDRDRYLTDPEWMERSAKELLAPDHLDAMAGRIDMRRAVRPVAGGGARGGPRAHQPAAGPGPPPSRKHAG
jgi:gamma-glutamyltranspeptidase